MVHHFWQTLHRLLAIVDNFQAGEIRLLKGALKQEDVVVVVFGVEDRAASLP